MKKNVASVAIVTIKDLSKAGRTRVYNSTITPRKVKIIDLKAKVKKEAEASDLVIFESEAKVRTMILFDDILSE